MHVCSTRFTRLITLSLLLCLAFTACVAYAAESDAQVHASLYFNSDGGKYYHADENCASVSEKYLPLKPIPNAELTAEPYVLLTACPLCVIDTAFYFNPDGGKYYHTDENCASVQAAALPLQQIPNADLAAEPYALLTTCPLCAAEMAQ